MSSKLKVLLTTEGTYPFHQGGVSTWCDILVNRLEDVEFTVYSVLMDPFVTQKFEMPPTANLVKMPLWGTEEPSEHLETPFSETYFAKKRTNAKAIENQFIPLFEKLIHEILTIDKNPQKLAEVMLELHLYFQYYEYKVSFKSEQAWESYKSIVLDYVQKQDSRMVRPDIYCLVQSLGWIYRFLNILNTPVPSTDVTHSSAAAFCSIPCVLAKLKNNTPFMLTEHGVYLREQYLSLSKREYPSFLNSFLMRLVNAVTSLSYHYADQLSPVCRYNTRWESEFGIPQDKIKVIYNGVDEQQFLHAAEQERTVPTIVTAARIDPIKDIEMLIRTADLVRRKIPDVQFVIYGSVSVPEYYEKCLELRKQLGLEQTVIFEGHTHRIAEAYKSGDLVALTSISEAFPYSVVEAMMSGKVVVSTDVGGIREALGPTGVLVQAGDHESMAGEIVRLMGNPELRMVMAEEARDRALSMFTIDRVIREYQESYRSLSAGQLPMVRPAEPAEEQRIEKKVLSMQHLWMERGLACKAAGLYEEAAACFRHAMDADSASPAVPVLLLEMAEMYNHLGEYEKAFQEFEKSEIYQELMIG